MRRFLGASALLTAMVVVGSASAASAGEITSEGFHNDTPGGTYISLSFFPYLGTQLLALDTTEQGTTTIGAGYEEVSVFQDVGDRRPGQCSQGVSRNEWTCALATAPTGSPFVIRGHAGDDTITESGCDHTGMSDMLTLWPNGSPCPRTFQYLMGDGDDIVRISGPDLTPNRLPSEANDPVYTFTMRNTLMDGGAGHDQLLVTDGPISGTAQMGAGSDYVHTAKSTGSWTVSCGDAIDAVRTGPDDVVGLDCERVNGNSRPRAVADRMRASKSREALVVRPLANDRDGGTDGYEESYDDDTEGAPIQLARITTRPTCGRTTYRKGALRFIAPRRGCARSQSITYVITDGLLVSQPATITLPAVRALPRRSR